jgi:hypothetical protein
MKYHGITGADSKKSIMPALPVVVRMMIIIRAAIAGTTLRRG